MSRPSALDWLYDWRSADTLPLGRPVLIRICDHIGLWIFYEPPILFDVQWRPLMAHRVTA